jgi:hypothetical protein
MIKTPNSDEIVEVVNAFLHNAWPLTRLCVLDLFRIPPSQTSGKFECFLWARACICARVCACMCMLPINALYEIELSGITETNYESKKQTLST